MMPSSEATYIFAADQSISRGTFDDVPLKPLHCEHFNSLSSADASELQHGS
jgi:hypothetical protein